MKREKVLNENAYAFNLGICQIIEIDLEDKNYGVSFHEKLNRFTLGSDQNLTENEFLIISGLPIFLKKSKDKYYLVGKYHVYSAFTEKGIYKFPAFVIEDEQIAERIIYIRKLPCQVDSFKVEFPALF